MTDVETQTSAPEPGPTMARRGLMLGAGVAALAAGTLAGRLPASAEPKESPDPDPSATRQVSRKQELSPVASTIASPPISGYTYRHVSWLDFQPESGTANRGYGGLGAYSNGSSPFLWATVEIPAGALVRDIEWYAYNNSGSTVNALGRLWAAGTGTLFATLADTPIESTGSVLTRRSVIASANYGPHPLGTKIALGLNTGGSAGIQVNGARVGFTQGSGSVGLLPNPIRAYDSRVTGGKLTANTVRTITLSSTLVQPGTSGLVVNIAAVAPVAGGYLKVYPGNAAEPAASTINFQPGQAIANMIFLGVSSSRQIKFYASAAVHVVVDITGTIG